MTDVKLYSGRASAHKKIQNRNCFAGLALTVASPITIRAIGCEFSGVKPEFLYLYNHDFDKPIAIFSTHETAWKFANHDGYLSEGTYYIGYFQGNGEALRMDVNWGEKPCDCNSEWTSYYNSYKDKVSISGFEIEKEYVLGGIDYGEVLINQISNYGLNLRLSL
jgi:hypothetical protein